MKKIAVVMTLPSSTMKITGLRTSVRGSSLRNESPIAARTISRVKRLCWTGRSSAVSWSSARLSSSTFTPGSPKKPSEAAVRGVVDQLAARARAESPRTSATRARLQLGVGGRDVRVDARARGRDGVDRDVADRRGPGCTGPRASRIACDRARRPPSRGRGSSGRGSRSSCRPRCSRRREGRGWKYSRLRERLRGELRADDLCRRRSIEAAVRLVRERELRRSRS